MTRARAEVLLRFENQKPSTRWRSRLPDQPPLIRKPPGPSPALFLQRCDLQIGEVRAVASVAAPDADFSVRAVAQDFDLVAGLLLVVHKHAHFFPRAHDAGVKPLVT